MSSCNFATRLAQIGPPASPVRKAGCASAVSIGGKSLMSAGWRKGDGSGSAGRVEALDPGNHRFQSLDPPLVAANTQVWCMAAARAR